MLFRQEGPTENANLPGVKAVIFNADDFGARPETNAAILRAHREGVLTSASLMVGEAAAAQAVEMARQAPKLAVGLHLVVSDGRAVLPREVIPRLTDAGGRFPSHPALAGLRWFFSQAARRELPAEIEAQFARFAETGLPWDHVNGHQHLHMHPVVWDCMLRQCEAFGVRRVRVPCEEFRPATREGWAGRWMEWLFLRALRRRCLRTLAGRGFVVADRVYGHLETGRMTAGYIAGLLERLGGETNEIYLHPGTRHARPLPGGPPGMDTDLDALLSPVVRAAVVKRNLCLTTYGKRSG